MTWGMWWMVSETDGTLDSTHVPIIAPHVSEADLYNHKGHYSVLLQVKLDYKLKSWDINVEWPRKIYDARVFENSLLFHKGLCGRFLPPWIEDLQRFSILLWIIVDSTNLLPWIQKPYPEGQGITGGRQQYSAVEEVFGRHKPCWRRFLKWNDYNISIINQVIAACWILFNISKHRGEGLENVGDDMQQVLACTVVVKRFVFRKLCCFRIFR